MASSTLHFKSLIPLRALVVVLAALFAWMTNVLYTVTLNPEMEFLRKADSSKQAWAESLAPANQPRIVVCGGSSCMTSIMPERMMEKHHLRVLNMGLQAGIGPKILARYAVQSLHPGDTFILAFEPDTLTAPLKSEPQGIQFCFASGNQALLRGTPVFDWPGTLLDLRPGGYHVLTLIAKIAAQQPLYRYSLAEIHPGGWQAVSVKRDFAIGSDENISISADAKTMFTWIQKFCAKQHIRLAYSVPWSYRPANDAAGFRRQNLDFMRQVSEFVPVLKEPGLGIQTNLQLYADTPFHLTPEGASLRTDELAEQLQQWNLWSTGEIKTALETATRTNPTGK